MLSGMKAGMPPEVFSAIMAGAAKPSLDPATFAELEHSLGQQ
jgi:hypothetical protein